MEPHPRIRLSPFSLFTLFLKDSWRRSLPCNPTGPERYIQEVHFLRFELFEHDSRVGRAGSCRSPWYSLCIGLMCVRPAFAGGLRRWEAKWDVTHAISPLPLLRTPTKRPWCSLCKRRTCDIVIDFVSRHCGQPGFICAHVLTTRHGRRRLRGAAGEPVLQPSGIPMAVFLFISN